MAYFFKNIIYLLLLLLFTTACKNEPKATTKQFEEIQTEESEIASIIRNPVTADKPRDTVNVAKITFVEKNYEFGTVNEGDVVKHVFNFTNTGMAPLIISDAKSTCGCTIPKWPKEPIKPGGSGKIEVKFDTKNKHEKQDKHVTIISNAYPRQTVLHVKGFVTPKK